MKEKIPTTNDILNLLDDLENKLNRHKPQNNSKTNYYKQYNPNFNNNQIDINQYNNSYRSIPLNINLFSFKT